MATHQLPCCGFEFGFIIGANQPSHALNEVVLTVADHRQATLSRPRLRIPFPPAHYYSNVLVPTYDFCNRHLSLLPCCVYALLPHFFAIIQAAITCFRHCSGLIPIYLHIFPRPSTHHLLYEEEESAALRESFEAASPKPTPASMESISKLVEDNMKRDDDEEGWSCGNNTSCMICLEEMETTRSSLKMPCSHVFHQDCIVSWLKNSHLCPLCRYEMPVSSASGGH